MLICLRLSQRRHKITKINPVMRNSILVLLIFISTTAAFSQYKIGFQFSPILSANRVTHENPNYNIDSDGTALKLALGPIVDIQLTDSYFLSTGILFASKRAGFEARDAQQNTFKEEYDLQYLQIPATMKLFTNEVSLDKRLFFQFGGNVEINIKDDSGGEGQLLVEDFQFFDFSLLAGVGMEYQLGTSTIAFASLSYHRGLVNAVSAHNDLIGKVTLKNDYIGLNFGVKF